MSLDPISAGFDLVGRIIGLFPNADDKQKQALAEIQAQVQLNAAQAAINQAEAASTSLFVAGWRPFIGWVCGAAFAWVYVLCPFLTWAFAAAQHPLHDLPVLDLGELMPLLIGMLGLGGMRTFERVRGVIPKGR